MDSFTDKFDKEDYYISEDGYIVFTEAYHIKRGYCCESNCRHCPWKESRKLKNENKNKFSDK